MYGDYGGGDPDCIGTSYDDVRCLEKKRLVGWFDISCDDAPRSNMITC